MFQCNVLPCHYFLSRSNTEKHFQSCSFLITVGHGIFADQVDNAALVEDHGYGLRLLKYQLEDPESIKDIIEKVACKNSTFAIQASRFSEMWRSQMKISARDQATFWIESLLKYKDFKHLIVQDYHLYTLQYFSIDVILFLMFSSSFVCICVIFLVKRFCFKTKTKTD